MLKSAPSPLRRLFFRSLQFLTLSALILSLLLFLSSPLLSIFGASMLPSVPALRILSLALPFFFITALFQWTLLAFHQEKLLIKTYAVGLLFNASVNLLLIPRWGFIAAPITTGLTEVLILLLLLPSVLKSFRHDS